MTALHHLSATPAQADVWRLFMDTLAPGDTAILLDQAVVAAAAIAVAVATDSRSEGVRWLVPAVELADAAIFVPPAGIVAISDEHWWSLIADHDVVLEWN